jgi:hypothetical protein
VVEGHKLTSLHPIGHVEWRLVSVVCALYYPFVVHIVCGCWLYCLWALYHFSSILI